MKEAITKDEFKARTGLNLPNNNWNIKKVVPLKDIVKVRDLNIMPEHYLEGILRNVTLEGDSTVQPYKDADIRHYRVDPTSLMLAQTFVERKKYQRLIEDLGQLFSGFCTNNGFAKCTALIVVGETNNEGEIVAAHYLPPLIEVHTEQPCLFDGTHRNYITMRIGTTIESVIMRNIKTPVPCTFSTWSMINVVDAKPPREERFINLNAHYFRNLGFTGIDG